MKTNHYIQITGLPHVSFAHIFGAQTYSKTFQPWPEGHEVTVEVTYITQGELYYVGEDGDSVRVPAHTLLTNTHGFSFRIQAPTPHEHHTVGFRIPARRITEEAWQAGGEGIVCLPLMLFDLSQGKNPFLPMIDEILSIRTMQSGGELACQGLVLQLLDRIDRYARTERQLPYINRSYVKQAKQYIFAHMREPIRQGDIAAHLGISSEYLCALFKRAEGIPIMQFINRTKLRQILTVMKNDRIPLSAAAEMYGYADPNYVSRLYRQYFGCPITQALERESAADISQKQSAKETRLF